MSRNESPKDTWLCDICMNHEKGCINIQVSPAYYYDGGLHSLLQQWALIPKYVVSTLSRTIKASVGSRFDIVQRLGSLLSLLSLLSKLLSKLLSLCSDLTFCSSKILRVSL